jgi:hypothetical protein
MISFIKWLIKFSVVISIFFSITFLCYSLGQFYCEHIYNLNNLFFKLSIYSSIYKFSFVILATYLTIEQLSISQGSYFKTVQQLHFTQEDILVSRKNAIKKETIDHCVYYLTEMQESFRILTNLNVFNELYEQTSLDFPIEINSLTNRGLYNIVSNNTNDQIPQISIQLHKFEAFSALFTHGNLDLQLGKELIGENFIKQVELLFFIIAIFRENDDEVFGTRIIKLYNLWN